MAEITVKTRDQIVQDYERNYLNRSSGTLTGPGTAPRRDAVLLADALMPLYANIVKAGRSISLDERTETELRQLASDRSIPLSGAVGSTGTVTIVAATTGTTIFAGDEAIEPTSKLVFYCTTTAAYSDGESVPMAARSTGPATNLDADTVLQWRTPRPGCATTCTVDEQTDGSGFIGGAEADGREQIIEKIRSANANPPASGNSPDYQRWIKATPNIQVEEAFIYPCALGPGGLHWTFTVAPNRYGSRVATATQLALVRAYISATAPKHDMGVGVATATEDLVLCIGVDWETAAEQWHDESPWPEYYEETPASGSGAVVIDTGSTATSLVVKTANADYSTCGDPVAGQVFGLYDLANRAFRRFTALSVAGSGPWTITVDTAFDASFAGYTPVVGQRLMPWSDGLSLFVAPVHAAFDGIGPGERVAATYLDGTRAKRYPPSPKHWPDRITKSLETTMESMGSVTSLDILEGLGVVATPSATPNILTLSDLAAYPRP
jgi:uncharacterized phage protein gp47/JayE